MFVFNTVEYVLSYFVGNCENGLFLWAAWFCWGFALLQDLEKGYVILMRWPITLLMHPSSVKRLMPIENDQMWQPRTLKTSTDTQYCTSLQRHKWPQTKYAHNFCCSFAWRLKMVFSTSNANLTEQADNSIKTWVAEQICV